MSRPPRSERSSKASALAKRPKRRAASKTHFFKYQLANNPGRAVENDLKRAIQESLEEQRETPTPSSGTSSLTGSTNSSLKRLNNNNHNDNHISITRSATTAATKTTTLNNTTNNNNHHNHHSNSRSKKQTNGLHEIINISTNSSDVTRTSSSSGASLGSDQSANSTKRTRSNASLIFSMPQQQPEQPPVKHAKLNHSDTTDRSRDVQASQRNNNPTQSPRPSSSTSSKSASGNSNKSNISYSSKQKTPSPTFAVIRKAIKTYSRTQNNTTQASSQITSTPKSNTSGNNNTNNRQHARTPDTQNQARAKQKVVSESKSTQTMTSNKKSKISKNQLNGKAKNMNLFKNGSSGGSERKSSHKFSGKPKNSLLKSSSTKAAATANTDNTTTTSNTATIANNARKQIGFHENNSLGSRNDYSQQTDTIDLSSTTKTNNKQQGGNDHHVQMVKKSLPQGSWSLLGVPEDKIIYLRDDEPPRRLICYPAIKHVEGDVIQVRDSVLLRSGARKTDLPFVAKVCAFWEDAESGNIMMSLYWYYRPEHTEDGRKPHHLSDEIFASRHRDVDSVECIEDKCYVLTFNEYCRYKKRCKMEQVNTTWSLTDVTIPLSNETYPRRNRIPDSDVNPELVFCCRQIYDSRMKRLLKNPLINPKYGHI